VKFRFRRVLTFLFSLWGILTIGFVCLYLLPGDPARIILGPQASAETVANFRHDAGLDAPFGTQYVRFLERSSRFDFGESIAQRRPVAALLGERTGKTLLLLGYATLCTLLGGFILPLSLMALGFDRLLLRIAQLLQFIAFVPPYALAVLAVIIFASLAQLVPVLFREDDIGSWILTSTVLASYPTVLLLRVLLVRLDEELRTPYAHRAAALGFPLSDRVLREALPNVLPASLGVLINNISFFITGAFFVEVVTGFPGLGRLAQQAIAEKDVPVLTGVVMVFALLVLLLSLGLEILQDAIAPRRRIA